jgi:predicted O-linked N-acetylglucosamine transferase (SPINDLY family)
MAERIRVGFLSRYFRQHSVAKMLAGLVRHLGTSLSHTHSYADVC